MDVDLTCRAVGRRGDRRLAVAQSLDHGMADENCAQSALIVELGFKRKDTEHQIEPVRHLLDAAAVPGPHLRTDVINYFLRLQPLPQRAGKPQIESGIIDQHNRVRLARPNFIQSLVKLFSKVAVMFDHFPEPEDAGFVDPVLEIVARDRFHLRSAAPDEAKIDIGLAQRAHQCRSVIVRARLPRDKVDRLSHSIRFAL